MKNIFIFFLFFAATQTFSKKAMIDPGQLDFIRQKFYECIEDEDQIDKLESYLRMEYGTDYININPIITAYYGALEALRGKHAFFPFTKLSYVNSSQKILEKAVELDPSNLEIRFLRFSILHHIPSILGYSEEREDDLKVIYHLLLKQDYTHLRADIQKGIVEFLLDSERLSKEQTSRLKKLSESFVVK